MKRAFYIVLAASLFAGLLLSASTQQAAQKETPAKTTSSVPAPQSGGTFKILWGLAPTSIGYPPELSTNAAYSLHLIGCFEGLLDFDREGRFKPTGLATGLKIAPDGKSLTITLRKGVKFHDGTDFNAEAVKWNLDQMMKARSAGTESWTSIEIVNEYAVRINLSEYDGTFIYRMVFRQSTLAYMTSPTAFKKNGLEWARLHPVGTGPFKFKAFDRDVSLEFERFDGYWGRKAYLDGIKYFFVKDSMTQMASLRAGEENMIYWADPKLGSDLGPLGYQVLSRASYQCFLMPDSANPGSALANKKVRQALEHAIDREAISKAVGYGALKASNQPAVVGDVSYDSGNKGREYNPSKAKQLLVEAGYPNGFQTKISWDKSLQVDDAMTAIQGYWKAVGVDCKLEPGARVVWEEYRAKGWHDGFVYARAVAAPPWINGLNQLVDSKHAFFNSTQRLSEWDKVFKEARTAISPENYGKLARDLVKMLYEETSFIPLYEQANVLVLDKSVRDAGFQTGFRVDEWNRKGLVDEVINTQLISGKQYLIRMAQSSGGVPLCTSEGFGRAG